MNRVSRGDLGVLISLVLLALFIWLRDTSWSSSSDDTLPILIALPLFYWIGRPWELTEPVSRISTRHIVITAALFLVGILLNSTLLLAVGWTYLLWSWLSERTPQSAHDKIAKLLILPFMAFPWLTLDGQPLGWWFRLSGAYVTGAFYKLLGYGVTVDGTNLLIGGVPISVEAACSGLNTLQSMLIAGSVVAYLILGESQRYWWNLPMLVVMAWVANTCRIIVIAAMALIWGVEFALGTFHTFGGWLLIMLMFLLCWFLFYLQEPKPQDKQ